VPRRESQWTAMACRTCSQSLVAVPEPTVPFTTWHDHAFVHHDGWDPETLDIRQLDPGHTPILRKKQTAPPRQEKP
jgi:hypothetical protein